MGEDTKKIHIEVELSYPACDYYDVTDVADFVKEYIQDWLNANLSDGDDRLKLTSVTVGAA